ncbi:hypothetical protein FVQ98_12565 [Ottowia sp. GY511]|uniref:IPTL-CTERM sorting domain-containing protein n=1 Tax=Ottowia flava TaxID=2675430 RepID=A0ABW4KX99_9BURK|nr:hypothetical protein [Ottowia sp. GY511]TXK27095.1 hypothetical protein FVQ98_12565 [Ottowia sp. GY511]
MRLRRTVPSLAAFALCVGSLSSHAAQQCLTNGPGTYGTVTVTGCDSDPPHGLINPLPGASVGLTFDGIAIVSVGGTATPVTCALTFSHPILTSSVRISVDAHQQRDVLSILLNGAAYTPVAADLAALPGSPAPYQLAINGNTIVGIGSSTSVPPTGDSAGIVSLTNNAPATLTSLTLNETPGDAGSLLGVCFDDALPPPAAVPTQSTGTLAAMGLMAALLAAWGLRRRASHR